MKIRQAPPKLVTANNVMAARIAGIALPKGTRNVFKKLKKSWHGSNLRVPMSNIGERIEAPESTVALKESLKHGIKATRSELAERLGLPLPNLIAPPERGIATAVQQQQQEEGMFNGQQEQVSNSNMVDDAGWSRTLAQTVGSGMLSASQLQAASYNNVYNMIGQRTSTWTNPRTGAVATPGTLSSSEKQEMTFMLQRMILEGYTEGVDVAAMIKKMPGGRLNLATSNSAALGLGVAGYGYGAMLDKNWWGSASDIDKIGLFYQEVGHALGVAPHTRGLMEGSDTILSADSSAKANYGKYVGWFFDDVVTHSSRDIKASSSDRLSSAAVQELLKKNTSWIPSLSGGAIPSNPAGGSDDPNGTGGLTGGNGAEPPAPVNISNTYAPAAINPGGVAPNIGGTPGQLGGGGGEINPTPVAGYLPSDILSMTKGFAAGMADLSTPNPTAIEPGLLLKSG